MLNKLRIIKSKRVFIFLFLLGLSFKGLTHSPDLSSLMIYEQNGKHFLAVKSALTAFEGEVEYHFGKNAYKTPEEFKQLVSKHFQTKCLLIINNDTLKFGQPTVILGHETTIFVELPNLSYKINSLYLKNEMFAELPQNLCELILMVKGYPQKQFILKNDNLHAVKLLLENGAWRVEEKTASFLTARNLLLGSLLFLVIFFIIRIRFSPKPL